MTPNCQVASLFLCINLISSSAYAQSDVKIIMPYSSSIEIMVNNTISNNCDGNFGISSPIQQEIFSNYNNLRGETRILGPFSANSELVFYIEPLSFCSGYKYLSTNSSHAKIYPLSEGIWRIEWEDLPDNWPPDNDFDDLIVTIRLVGAYPDYKQNVGDWKDDIYDHNTSTEDTISRWGCAMTDIANLLTYYGARDTDPGILDSWLKDNNGYGLTGENLGDVNWSSVDNYSPKDSDVRVIRWVENLSRNNPNYQVHIDENLSNNWPVILQYQMEKSPSKVHYIIALGKEENVNWGQEYIIRDPYASSTSITSIPVDDPGISQAIIYRPADGIIRPSIILTAHSPIAYLLVDEQGRRIGYDPSTGIYYWEIPGGNYAYNPPYWDPTNQSTTQQVGEGLELSLPGLGAGNYRLNVFSTGNGPYEIGIFYNADNGQNDNMIINETAQVGTSTAYEMQVSSNKVNFQQSQKIYISSSTTKMTTGSSSTITATLKDGQNNPISGQKITMAATMGNIPDSVYTDQNGIATVEFKSEQTTGTSRISARTDTTASYMDITIVNENPLPPKPSSGGGFGIAILVIVLVLGGTSILLITGKGRNRRILPKISPHGVLGTATNEHIVGPLQAELHALDGPLAGTIIPLIDGLLIGRGSGCQLQILDKRVSRQHARLRYARGRWYIQDIGSRWGMYVNGTVVHATVLSFGDRIRIGSTEFEFRMEGA